MKQNIENATSKNDLPAPDSLTFNEPGPKKFANYKKNYSLLSI